MGSQCSRSHLELLNCFGLSAASFFFDEIEDGFLTIPAMQAHWKPRSEFYPADFSAFIGEILVQINAQKKAEVPLPETSA
jgi:hypothetical protein